jgi:tetratricopeptide (TPR) repeat protein
MDKRLVRQVLDCAFARALVITLAVAASAGAFRAPVWCVQVPGATAQSGQVSTPLEVGKPVERELKPGEKHTYHVTLTAGQFFRAVVRQRGIDVVVTLFGPDGKRLVEGDSPNGSEGPEPVLAVTEESGTYRLEVRPLDDHGAAGRYEVKVEELRAATAGDRSRVAAQRAYAEAVLLSVQGTRESLLESVEKYRQSLRLYRDAGDRVGEALTLNAIGLAYYELRELQKALEHYEQALQLARALGDRSSEAETLNNLGRIHYELGDYGKSLEKFLLALPLFRESGDVAGEARTLSNLGAVYDNLGDRQKALEILRRALSLRRSIGDRTGEAITLHNIGGVYSAIGEKRKALEYLEQARSLYLTIGDRLSEAYTLNNLGAVYSSLGDRQRALDYYTQALVLHHKLGERQGEAMTLNNIGKVYDEAGDIVKALEYYEQALPMARAGGDRHNEATLLNNIGAVYNSRGDRQKALDYYEQALSLRRQMGDRHGEAAILSNLAAAYSDRGEKQKALDLYAQVLSVYREFEDREGEATTLNNLGKVYSDLGEKRKALNYYEQALPITRAIGNRASEATALSNIGAAYNSLGEKQKALDYYQRALLIMKAIADRRGEADTQLALGTVYESLGELTKALDSYLQTIATQEQMRAAVGDERLNLGAGEASAEAYWRAALLYLSAGQSETAFNLSERMRARNVLDQLARARVRVPRQTPPQLAEREATLRQQMNGLDRALREERAKRVGNIDLKLIGRLETELTSARREYEALLTQIKLPPPESPSLMGDATLTVSQVQTLLDPDTTLLSYLVTPERTVVFVISRNLFQAVQIPLKEGELFELLHEFRSFANLKTWQTDQFQRLYQYLITPIRQYLSTPLVGIVPHGALHYLPFSALSNGSRYLDEEHTIFYLPSASILQHVIRNRKHNDSLLAVSYTSAEGHPPLPYAESEVRLLVGMYKKARWYTTLTGDAATESGVRALAGRYGILHLAAHYELNTESPLLSRLVLAPDKNNDGFLELHEVYDLNLSRTDLVVLSDSQTQLGRQTVAADLIALDRAFIYAGASTVIGSLWDVDDQAKGWLMASFYKHLKQGMSKAAALRSAQAETRVKYPHPYYWAAFVLTGDPGTISLKMK